MNTIDNIQDFRDWRKDVSNSLGFIPTMGALHDGHLSLIAASNNMCQHTVVCIYLNPIQFSKEEDLDTYPQDLKRDLEALSKFQIDALFLPKVSEMYPADFSTHVQETKLSMVLEGKSRPSFFKGVTTVVAKLLNIVCPTHAFFGQKDAQQLIIIKKIVADLAYNVKIIACPIVREKNGLAMSSRNLYLPYEKQKIAAKIYMALQKGKSSIISGERDAQVIREKIIHNINKENNLQIDYVSVADAETLIEFPREISNNILVSIAIFIDGIRIIDNFRYSFSKAKKGIQEVNSK